MSEAATSQAICCQRCGRPLARLVKGMLKMQVSSRLIAFDMQADGQAEMPCPFCHRDTILPGVRFFFRTQALRRPEP